MKRLRNDCSCFWEKCESRSCCKSAHIYNTAAFVGAALRESHGPKLPGGFLFFSDKVRATLCVDNNNLGREEECFLQEKVYSVKSSRQGAYESCHLHNKPISAPTGHPLYALARLLLLQHSTRLNETQEMNERSSIMRPTHAHDSTKKHF